MALFCIINAIILYRFIGFAILENLTEVLVKYINVSKNTWLRSPVKFIASAVLNVDMVTLISIFNYHMRGEKCTNDEKVLVII